jgi:hypothetical protein
MSEFDFGADWQGDLSGGDGYDGGHDAALGDLGDLGHFDGQDAHFGAHIDDHSESHDPYAGESYHDELDHHFDHLDEAGHEAEPAEHVDGDLLDFSGLEEHGIHGGGYDMFGADPHEDDLWSQLKADLSDEINPYVAN